jgi:hypothetical protein
MTFEADHIAPHEAGFEALTSLLRLIADPKSYQRQLDALMAAATRAREEAAGLKRAQADFAQAEAGHLTACAEREVHADEQAALGANRQAEADRKEARLDRIAKDIREHDARLRREVMRFSNLLPGFSEKLQSLPSWSVLADEVLNSPGDADDIDGAEHIGRDADEAADHALPSEPPADVIAGSTLTQRGGHRGGAGRRAQ